MEVIIVAQCIVNIHIVSTSAAVYVYISKFLASSNYTHFISLNINFLVYLTTQNLYMECYYTNS